jgi:hypothetical protein
VNVTYCTVSKDNVNRKRERERERKREREREREKEEQRERERKSNYARAHRSICTEEIMATKISNQSIYLLNKSELNTLHKMQ